MPVDLGFFGDMVGQVRQHYPELLRGYGTTIWLTCATMLLALSVGLFVSLLRTSEFKPLRFLSGVYVEVFRNTPLLVQLFFLFFALPKLPPFNLPVYGRVTWLLSPIQASLIGLTLYTGAYTTEALRSGLMAIDKGQTEAARALGLNYVQTRLYVIIPQAFRVAVPLLTSILSALFRNTALASTIGVVELLNVADRIQQQNFRTFELFTLAGILYLSLTLPLAYASGHLERWVARAR